MKKAFAPHLLAFAPPIVSLVYLLSGPHAWYGALPWLGIQAAWVFMDDFGGKLRRAPDPKRRPMAAWPFDGMLCALALLQLANVLLLARMVSRGGFFRVDTVVAVINTGLNSALSAIVVAHELVHRKGGMRLLGRALLATVFYEHFATEHIRGHHVRVATSADPSTARFDETLNHFFLRTVPAQLASAWRLETRRLGDVGMRLWDRRQLRNAVLHGIIAESAFACVLAALFGPGALAAHLLHCYNAVRLLETVNYFEHWGLERQGPKVQEIDSWDSDARMTFYMMVGLSRHADHHAHAARPFQELSTSDVSPRLPYGYPRMIWLSETNNRLVRQLLTAELARCRLGPFAPKGREHGASVPTHASS
jgi:alkane 1-monooxygenase